ncbi:MAG: efflux RND transporter periplasmic adaptor subunit [Myxococcota bacterium]|nr:efflux RND transporter periplasmic adaptor subunit [Myxococcota bacterium]
MIPRGFRLRWILVLALLLPGCGEEAEAPAEVIRSIKAVTISKRPTGRQRRFSGVLAATDKSELSFRVDGRVQAVAVEDGAHVRAGQLLASIEPQPYVLALETAIADLQAARAQLGESEKKLDSTRRLFERKIASQQVLDGALASYETAEGRVQSADAAVNMAQRDLDDTIISAPFAGLIAERSVEPFQEVSAGDTVLVLTNEGAVEVETRIPEGLIHEVAVGQPVTVRLTTAAFRGQSFPGRVTRVSGSAHEANAYPVTINVEEPDPRMRPGMTARVDFTFSGAADTEGWLLPANAVLPADDASEEPFFEREVHVFVYDPDTSTVEKRPVRVAGIEDRFFEISEGLAEGEIVAVAGVHFLRDGLRVTLYDEGTN